MAPPPVQQSTDANGVDLALGHLSLSAPALSIGPAAPHGLVYAREYRGGGWRDNVIGTIARDSSGRIIVSIGGSSDRFAEDENGNWVGLR